MERKRQKEVEMQRLEQIREEFKKKTEGLLQFNGQGEGKCVSWRLCKHVVAMVRM